MKQDEIIEMARQANMIRVTSPSGREIGEWWGVELSDIEAFAKLVAAKEREACAKICEDFADVDTYPDGIIHDYHAHLIRLRGKT